MKTILRKKKVQKKVQKNNLTWESINIILVLLVIIRLKLSSPQFTDTNKFKINTQIPEKQEQVTTSTGFVKPFKGNFAVTSPFGYRMHPVLKYWRLHTGIDYGLSVGDEVTASNNGCIVHAGTKGGYGNTIVINHSNKLETLYGHNSELKVHNGQCVKRGELIALSGNSGMSTAPHLHFEIIKDGTPVNPAEYLKWR